MRVGGIPGVRLLAELAPVAPLDVNAVVLRRLLDVAEGEVAVLVRDACDLVEARQRVLDVRGVRERLFALLGEGVGALG
jgi:hypothetical protein